MRRRKRVGRFGAVRIYEQTCEPLDLICAAAVASRGRFCFRVEAARSISDDTTMRRYEGDPDLPPDAELARVQPFLGRTRFERTVRYRGVEVDDALEIAEKIDV